jgi:geranylgeranyl diphosphate synthase type II
MKFQTAGVSLSEYLKARQESINTWLKRLIPHENAFPSTIHRSMLYSLMAGGKRLRPILALAAAEAVDGDEETVLPFSCAIEMVHTYSLIHDDLPAMDNDDLRRGKPTCHKVFGEGIAILAGDALLTHAFTTASNPEYAKNLDPAVRITIIHELAKASGTEGMIGGQVLDLEAQNSSLGLDELSTIHKLKTGSLIMASTKIGALAAGGTKKDVESLSAYGQHLGLAFQIMDDLLDIEGSEEIIGKTSKSDLINHKSTYPALMGVAESREKAKDSIEQALAVIDHFDHRADALRQLAHYTITREK